MSSKDRILQTLAGHRVFPPPCSPHGWGVYKFELAGIIHDSVDEANGWKLSGAELAEVDSLFYETFHPDLFHLSSGAWRSQPGDVDRQKARSEFRPGVIELNNKRLIDDYVEAITPSEEEIALSGIYDHIPIIQERYGNRVLIILNEGNPTCEVFENGGPAGDFQDAMSAVIEQPENLAYLLWKLYESSIGRIRVLKSFGADGYIGSETCVAADMLSPASFRSLVFPALKMFYQEIEKIGLIPITYFLGDVVPLLSDISNMGVRGLMVEESKKAFELDVVKIRRLLDDHVTLFGNLDSIYHLLWGDFSTIEAETRRQLACAKDGPFIMSCGSPICLGTPVRNVKKMVEVATSLPGIPPQTHHNTTPRQTHPTTHGLQD
jgi:uroporphyrinogen-III decarboxylase